MVKRRRRITLDEFLKPRKQLGEDKDIVDKDSGKKISRTDIEKEVHELFSQLFSSKSTENKVREEKSVKEEKASLVLVDKKKQSSPGNTVLATKIEDYKTSVWREGAREDSSKQHSESLSGSSGSLDLLSDELLKELLNKPVGPERAVTCSNDGTCSDGIRISEVFRDEKGVVRQRGFIRTSRIPIILDWVVEHGTVKKILPKAYKLVTQRGAKALVPEEFICELATRYGILINNYDCKNYQINLNTLARKKK